MPPRWDACCTLGSSRWFQSNVGRSLRIGGSHVKLCSGGGEVVAHSSVCPSHGLSLAGTFRRNARNRSISNRIVPMAMRYVPIVETKFGVLRPTFGG